jgi:membrane protein required for colicin V production
LAAATFVEDNVTMFGKRFKFAPKDSVLFSLARTYNLFEMQQFAGVKDLVQVAKLAENPKTAGKLKNNVDWQELKKDARFNNVIDAASVQKAIEAGDYRTLLKSNQVLELISDPDASRRLERLAELSEQ